MNRRAWLLAALAVVLAVVAVLVHRADSDVPPRRKISFGDLTAADVDALPSSQPTAIEKYGAGALQFGELRLPGGKGPHPVVVVIHGGCWTKGLATVRNTAPIASDLAQHGVATWNIEYRQLGDEGGGWPGTFLDWGAAVDYLQVLEKSYSLDLRRVLVIGHSAGAHAALWVAGRGRLPATSEIRGAAPLPVAAAVALDGPGDLVDFTGFDRLVCGQPVVARLMGGTPEEQPERYRQGSPRALLPLGVPQYLVTCGVLAPESAEAYRRAAQGAGDAVEVLDQTAASHFAIIAPGQKSWGEIRTWMLGKVLPGGK